jgi:hypothetical protein
MTTHNMAVRGGTADTSGTAGKTSRFFKGPAMIGFGYSASWVAGLSIWSSSTKVRTSGAAVLADYAGHEGVAMTQFLLTEGLPALGLGFVAVALGRAARRAGLGTLGRAVTVTGMAAATISFVQFLMGVYLTGWAVPGRHAGAAGSLLEGISRLDGVKMLLLAALTLAGTALVHAGVLPRWLGYTGVALAVAIAVSGIGYLFLLSGPAVAAWVSLPLLLVWVTGACVALGRTGR